MLKLLTECLDTCPDCGQRLEPVGGWLICLKCAYVRLDPFSEDDISCGL